jgi:hypothetical protein
MVSVLRRAVAVASLVAVSAGSAQAQMGTIGMGGMSLEEIRVNLVGLTSSDGGTSIGLNFPGSLALAFYLNDKIAIEPMVGFNMFSPDVGDASSTISLGVLVPYYLGSDRGVSGLFIAPGFNFSKTTDIDATTSIGAEFGLKKAWKEKISWRVAGAFWTSDGNSTIGVNAGLSMFWR